MGLMMDRILGWLDSFLGWGVSLLSLLQKAAARPKAARLNWVLYQPVKSISPEELREVRENLRQFSLERDLDPERIDHWAGHAQRLILTRAWLRDIISQLPETATALDLGPPSVATDYWKSDFPDLEWSNSDWDLRYPWPLPADSVNLICCTELIEHLSDIPNELYNEGFYQVGFREMLLESCRVLSPGGLFFGSTPNAASIYHLEAVLQGQPPWLSPKHVREYTRNEISYQFSQAGFEILNLRDIHCLSVNSWKDYTSLFVLLLCQGFPTQGRGDDLFFTARKLP